MKPTAFHDLGPENFPMVMQALDDETLEKLWQVVVDGPGAVEVPGFAPRKVRTRIWFATGTVVESYPDGSSAVFDLSEELASITEYQNVRPHFEEKKTDGPA